MHHKGHVEQPTKPISFTQTLLEELAMRLGRQDALAKRAQRTGNGTLTCATCTRTISANKLQCLACADMTQLICLVLSRPSGGINPEAEARIKELGRKYVSFGECARLAHFAHAMVYARQPKATFSMAVEHIARLVRDAVMPEALSENA